MRISDWSSDVCSSDLLEPSPSRGGLGGDGFRPFLQRGQDHLEHSFRILEDLVVPEPQQGKARALQHPCPFAIVSRRFRMLSSIELDHDSSLKTCEIENVVAERMLPPKFCSVDLPAPQRLPQLVFRSEEHTSELQSLMRLSYAVFC